MNQILAIDLADETFGLPVEDVTAVFRIERLTPVPLAAPEIAGLYNLRGKIIPVVSLRRTFDPDAPVTSLPSIAVGVHHDNEKYAILVDAVGGVEAFDDADRIAPPANGEPRRDGLTKALFARGDRLIAVLSVARLLARPRPLEAPAAAPSPSIGN